MHVRWYVAGKKVGDGGGVGWRDYASSSSVFLFVILIQGEEDTTPPPLSHAPHTHKHKHAPPEHTLPALPPPPPRPHPHAVFSHLLILPVRNEPEHEMTYNRTLSLARTHAPPPPPFLPHAAHTPQRSRLWENRKGASVRGRLAGQGGGGGGRLRILPRCAGKAQL